MFDPREALIQLRVNHEHLVKRAGIPAGLRNLDRGGRLNVIERGGLVDHLTGRNNAKRLARAVETGEPRAESYAQGIINRGIYGRNQLALGKADDLAQNNLDSYDALSRGSLPQLAHNIPIEGRLNAYKEFRSKPRIGGGYTSMDAGKNYIQPLPLP